MLKVYSCDNPVLVAQLRQVLEDCHIDCLVRNDFLSGAAGELPVNECWPEIWVLHDEQRDRARALVEAFLAAGDGADGPWTCGDCGEAIEAVFSECWSCGSERPPPGHA